MPPRLYSRHTFAKGVLDDSERLFLTEREPFRYRPLSDTRTHVVKRGDTLWNLAARYFPSFNRPAGLWWVIADFQPDPVFDPTIVPSPGAILLIPSERVVAERIFAESRRLEESV
jgi:nucleoid-associated protein YgaU